MPRSRGDREAAGESGRHPGGSWEGELGRTDMAGRTVRPRPRSPVAGGRGRGAGTLGTVPLHHRPRRDRHGRGPRGPVFVPGVPAWRTRRERFDEMVADLVQDFIRRWPVVSSIEFAMEDVPPSDPAEWEDHTFVLARLFPSDRRRGLADRIVLYRVPLEQRAARGAELEDLVRSLLIDRISRVVAVSPEDLDHGAA